MHALIIWITFYFLCIFISELFFSVGKKLCLNIWCLHEVLAIKQKAEGIKLQKLQLLHSLPGVGG